MHSNETKEAILNKIIKKKKDDVLANPSKSLKELRRLNILANDLENQDELAHVGVLGMRWGIRNDRSKGMSSRTTSDSEGGMSSKKISSKSVKKARKKMLKNRRTISDEELASAVNRLQMERRLIELASSDVAPGKVAVHAAMDKFMGVAIGAAAGAAAAAVVKKVFESKGA